MSNLEKLREWDVEARKKGLLDVKFVQGSDRYATPEQVAGEVLRVLRGDYKTEVIDNIDLYKCPEELRHFFLEK